MSYTHGGSIKGISDTTNGHKRALPKWHIEGMHVHVPAQRV